jgi:hypothetical protein
MSASIRSCDRNPIRHALLSMYRNNLMGKQLDLETLGLVKRVSG